MSREAKSITRVTSDALVGFRYRFGAVSDRHLDAGQRNFPAALATYKTKGCQFLVSSGDETINGTAENWQNYRGIVEASDWYDAQHPLDTQIYEIVGNHDNYTGIASALALFKQYSFGGWRSADGVGYYSVDMHGDRFIFAWLETGQHSTRDNFSQAQVDWIESQINSYRGGGHVWLITHHNLQNYGAGDWPEQPFYSGGMKVDSTRVQNHRLLTILESHPRMFHLHGHTHFSYRYVNGEAAYPKSIGLSPHLCAYSAPGSTEYTRVSGCTGIHIPSGCRLRYFNEGAETPTEHTIEGQSEGAVIEVYSNGIRITGINDYTGVAMFVHEVVFRGTSAKTIYEVRNGQRIKIWEKA